MTGIFAYFSVFFYCSQSVETFLSTDPLSKDS